MRYYVVINGVNSLTKAGLAISALPPISKPMKRTLREEIDGRDGDIITNLGYSAYDKTLMIGLYGESYDINDIIAFFNQSGNIVFSDEPDKYYKFEILEQIDYEKLLKFKQATVTIHCQPFKYPLNETPLVEEYEYVNGRGTNLTLNNTAEAIFNKIELQGNTYQENTTGKNLLGLTNGTYTPSNGTSGITAIVLNNKLTIRGTANGANVIDIPLLQPILSSLGTLTKSLNPTGTYTGVQTSLRAQSPNTSVGLWSTNGANISGALSGNAYYLRIQVNDTISVDCTMEAQVELGSTDTSFEQFTYGASPNPQFPQPIQVVSGDNEISITGRNIYNRGTATEDKILTWAGGQLYNSTGSLVSDFIRIDGGQKVNIDHLSNVFCYDKEKNFLGNLTSDGQLIKISTLAYNSVTIPTGENIYYIRFSSNVNTAGNTNVKTDNIMANLGNTQETYEPFNGETYPISLGDIELCKIGDYQDYLYKENGSWYLHKEIGKVVYEGTTTIDLSIDGVTHKCLYRSNYPEGKITTGTNGAFYERAKYITNASERAENTFYENPTNYLIIGSPTDTLDTLKTKFNGGLMYYPLATPTNTEITDTTLIEQLEALKQANSYDGQTNITQENNDLPFILDVSVVEKGSDEMVVNNECNIYSKPKLYIEGNGVISVYLNSVQAFSIDLSTKHKIVIDTTLLEAYDPDTNDLMNRQVTGDYSKFTLNVGTNIIKFSGDLTQAVLTNYKRWL